MAPRTPGDEAQGRVQGGDGARSPKPHPDNGGFHPAPGENPKIGSDWVHEGHDDPRTWNPTANSTSAGLAAGITPTRPGKGAHNRLHTGGQ